MSKKSPKLMQQKTSNISVVLFPALCGPWPSSSMMLPHIRKPSIVSLSPAQCQWYWLVSTNGAGAGAEAEAEAGRTEEEEELEQAGAKAKSKARGKVSVKFI